MVKYYGCKSMAWIAMMMAPSSVNAWSPSSLSSFRQQRMTSLKAAPIDFSSLEQKLLDTVTATGNSVDIPPAISGVWKEFLPPTLDGIGTMSDVLDLIQKFATENHIQLPTWLQEETLTKLQQQVTTALEQVLQSQQLQELPDGVVLGASTILSYMVVSFLLNTSGGSSNGTPSRPYPLGKYDPISARAYFDTRLPQVLARAIELATKSSAFALSLLQDYISDKIEENSEKRALELSQLLTELGPTFIKVGQSLSIRTDILSPAYVRGLKTLQDQVTPFSTKEAREILEEELGVPVEDVFSKFSSEPVAAASLGQVYRATLKSSGDEVAVKIQRPNIMEQIALDMHLLREFAPWAKRTFNLNTDTVGTVDVWGKGFVDELNYLAEAENGEYFTASIQTTPLAGVVFSPPIIEECTTDRILTTQWVEGERLDRSSSEDVTLLCSIAMNTYLTMMLETGVLHCDPHPGNLLRTPDGKLCILDWGMVTQIDPFIQSTLIEHMAHLTSADYDEIPRDLLLLGFIPESKADLIDDSGIVEVLADIYGAWTSGGGVGAINVNKVVAQLQDLTEAKGNLFQIPPYFAYIAKSFSVLEGIGLSNDAKYSIINECLPYVSKRLLTDVRTERALNTFIFGSQKDNVQQRMIDTDRIEQLISGFGDYTTSASGASLGSTKKRTDQINDLADQILELLATEEETPLQTIFVEQLAKILSSSSKSNWKQLRDSSGTLPSGRTVLGTIVDPLGLFRTSPMIQMNDFDTTTVETTRRLLELFQQQQQQQASTTSSDAMSMDINSLTTQELTELSSTLIQKVWSKRNGIAFTTRRLANQLLTVTADQLERGERTTTTTPSLEEPRNEKLQEPTILSTNTMMEQQQQQQQSSHRLETAKKILAQVEQEEGVQTN